MLHSWEEMGCLDNDNSEELEQLKAENDKLKTCLQEIKAIATHEIKELTDSAINGGRYLEILDLITKGDE